MSLENVDLFRKYLLSGGTPEATKELLDHITIEDMIFQLAALPSDAFVSIDDEYEGLLDDITILDDKYIGNIIIRCLDKLLNEKYYPQLFKNQQVIDVIKSAVETNSAYYVRLMVSKHLRAYIESGGKDATLEDLVWKMVFDEEYPVFENAARTVCTILKQNPSYLNEERINDIIAMTRNPEHGYVLRMYEFSVMLGKMGDVWFEELRDRGVYDMIFENYMDCDELVKLNCIQILESMVDLLNKLAFDSEPSRRFIRHVMEVFINFDESDIVAPSLMHFFVSILSLPNVFTGDEVGAFVKCVSDIILRNSPHNSSVYFIVTLSTFAPLYLKKLLSKEVIQQFLHILDKTTNETVVARCIDGLLVILEGDIVLPYPEQSCFYPADQSENRIEAKTKLYIEEELKKGEQDSPPPEEGTVTGQVLCDLGDHRAFLLHATKSVLSVMARFPFRVVKEQCYLYLIRLLNLEDRGIVDMLIREDNDTRVFSKSEDDYQVTLIKRKFIKKLMSSSERFYRDECPLANIDDLKKF